MASSLAASGRILARSAASSPSCSCPVSGAAARSASTQRRNNHRQEVGAAISSATFSASAAMLSVSTTTRLEARTAATLLSAHCGGRDGGPSSGGRAASSSSLAPAPSASVTRLPPPSGLAGPCGGARGLNPASGAPGPACLRSVARSSSSVFDGGVAAAAAGGGATGWWSPAEVAAATLLALATAGTVMAGVHASADGGVVGFAGPAVGVFDGIKAKFGGGGGGGGGGGPGPGGGVAPLSAHGASESVSDDMKDCGNGIEFEIAGRRVRMLGNATTTDWMAASVSQTKPKIEVPYIPKAYDVSIRALKGGRLSMEDEYFVANGGRFVAVFDGHGGGGVSQFLREKLYDVFGRHLHEAEDGCIEDPYSATTAADARNAPKDGRGAPMPTATSPRACSITSRVAAMRAAFDEVDREVCSNDDLHYQGSTAVAVVLHEEPDGTRTLVSANVGDSRAVLSRRGRAVDLTRDHKPNDEKEKARILGMGETIEWDHYCKVHRVRNLSLSRAIGDRFAKPAVSGEVEIKRFPVAGDGDEFILLASDGLWDVMSSQEAVSFVHKKLGSPLKSPGDAEDMERAKFTRRKNMSRFVANEALRRGSGDNVCVVIVWLKDSEFGALLQ